MPCTLYVMKCKTPNTYYVGTTIRPLYVRLREHFGGYGCKWTRRHGVTRCIAKWEVGYGEASRIENRVMLYYARIYGIERVRGGDVTFVGPDDTLPDWVNPQEFGGSRIFIC